MKSIELISNNVHLKSKKEIDLFERTTFFHSHQIFFRAQLIFRNALLESELELRIVRSFKKPSIPVSNSNEFNQTSKRLGKVIKITLIKGIDGLGFKLASRDNPTGVANPIYVKTIFPKGAAIEDGRLQNGDRLLMVNSIDVTQMSLQETVSLLRETRIGDTVHLCVSRQQDGSLPKDLVSKAFFVCLNSFFN